MLAAGAPAVRVEESISVLPVRTVSLSVAAFAFARLALSYQFPETVCGALYPWPGVGSLGAIRLNEHRDLDVSEIPDQLDRRSMLTDERLTFGVIGKPFLERPLVGSPEVTRHIYRVPDLAREVGGRRCLAP